MRYNSSLVAIEAVFFPENRSLLKFTENHLWSRKHYEDTIRS
jgi:hypothetical protein